MKTARIVVLAIAISAGAVAAYLASGSDPKSVATEPAAQLQTVDILVAKSDIGLGQSVTGDDVQWQTWPAATASTSFIRRKERPEATKEIVGSIARSPFIAGEPIREPKLVKATGSGFMAAILPTGMRAVSTEVSPETGAGGFILPNDRVDVILSKREKNPDRTNSADIVNSQVILSNIRVLAIDQTIEEKNGQKVVVGKTATLELKPKQSEALARARQSGTLSLALRSITDANESGTAPRQEGSSESFVNVFRGDERETYNCKSLCKKVPFGADGTWSAILAVPAALAVADTYLICSEVSYRYVPTVGYVMAKAGVNLSDMAHARPRQSRCVLYSSATACPH